MADNIKKIPSTLTETFEEFAEKVREDHGDALSEEWITVLKTTYFAGAVRFDSLIQERADYYDTEIGFQKSMDIMFEEMQLVVQEVYGNSN